MVVERGRALGHVSLPSDAVAMAAVTAHAFVQVFDFTIFWRENLMSEVPPFLHDRFAFLSGTPNATTKNTCNKIWNSFSKLPITTVSEITAQKGSFKIEI